MAEIIFQSKLDAMKFYNHLLKCLSYNKENREITFLEDRQIVQFSEERLSVDEIKKAKEAFYDFIVKIKQDDWLRSILKDRFYYVDPEEQEQILDIAYSVMDGKREDLAVFLKDANQESAVKESIEQIFKEHLAFSFDSFFKFRLRPYIKKLEGYVEISIDEYKLEQEYQMFVQTLRDFLINREPKMQLLHLLFDDEVTFYKENFEEMKRSELLKMIDRKLLVNHPVYVDSATIAPLLSLAPTSIFLYTRDPDEPLVRTIKNIFEERVTIKSFLDISEARIGDFRNQTFHNQ